MIRGKAARACLERKRGLQRWHFQHGPIDLIIAAEGDDAELAEAVEAAWARFETVLGELVGELAVLRAPVPAQALNSRIPLQGPVARRMYRACQPFAELDGLFVTPMAAVAGSVAQEILAHFRRPRIHKAWVNNGGDIAWHGLAGLGPAGEPSVFRVGLHEIGPDAHLTVSANDACRGIATSGWRGRSQSLGIADSVTVLAADAALADVAATLVANAVSLASVHPDHPAIRRVPASQVKDQSDLGDRLVTVAVGALTQDEVALALGFGEDYARQLLDRGAIQGAVLCLAGRWRVCGPVQPVLVAGA